MRSTRVATGFVVHPILAMALAIGAELPSFGPREREPRPHTKRDDKRIARAEAKRARKAARRAA